MLTPQSVLARKRLIVSTLVVAVLAAVSFLNNRDTVAQVDTAAAVVGIAQTVNGSGDVVYNPTEAQIDAAVREAIAAAGGLPDNVGPGKKIVIQPNLTEAGWFHSSPNHAGVLTHPQVVRTIVDMCLEAGAGVSDITICEGSAGFHGAQGAYTGRQMTRKAYKDAGFDYNGDMIDDVTGVRLVDANNVGRLYDSYPAYSGPYDSNYVTRVVRSDYLIDRAYYLPNCVVECDVLIRVPCLKNHDLAGLTAGLKLAFGLAPSDIYHAYWTDQYKWNLLHQESWGHDELGTNSRGIADLTLARPPDMVVVDALVGITTGPTREPLGRPSPYMASILAGKDVVAVDTICGLSIGYQINQNSCPGVYYASTRGLGQIDPGKIEVRGKRVSQIRRWFPAYGAGVPGERTPPTLGGLSLQGNVHVCGAVTVSPTAFFDSGSGVCKGELYANGELIGSSNNAAGSQPYAVTWLTNSTSSGEYTLTYILYDRMLNETQLSRTVQVYDGEPIGNALGLSDGSKVFVGPVRVTGRAAAIDDNTFFVSSPDGLRGLKVRYATTANVSAGQEVILNGTITTSDGQRVLNAVSCVVNGSGPAIRPRLFSNQDLGGVSAGALLPGVQNGTGPYNVGCLVKTTGRVYEGGAGYFYISDGSLDPGVYGTSKLRVNCGSFAKPAPNSFVSVVGFSCANFDGQSLNRTLVVRSQDDITVY